MIKSSRFALDESVKHKSLVTISVWPNSYNPAKVKAEGALARSLDILKKLPCKQSKQNTHSITSAWLKPGKWGIKAFNGYQSHGCLSLLL